MQTVPVPAGIIGKTLAEVQDELGGLGLQIAVASGSSKTFDALVSSNTPQAGSKVETGSTVILATGDAGDETSDNGTTRPSPTRADGT